MFTAATIKELRALGLAPDVEEKVLDIFERAREAKKKAKGGTVDRAARGTRLASDWALPISWGEFALSEGMPDSHVRRTAASFKDYWIARPGAGGIKLDWFATWRNWIRKECEDKGYKPVASVRGAEGGPEHYSDDTWRSVLRVYKLTGRWNPDNGPEPGAAGCKVPHRLLEAGDK